MVKYDAFESMQCDIKQVSSRYMKLSKKFKTLLDDYWYDEKRALIYRLKFLEVDNDEFRS